MQHAKMRPQALRLVAVVLTGALLAIPPHTVEAGDAGSGRRIGGIAEIDPVSAVNGSTVIRSLPTQEGEAGAIQILNAATGAVLASAVTSTDGQYEVVLPQALMTDQRIQAFNNTKDYHSSSVIVTAAAAPAINEPVPPGATQITGRGTPGSIIQIKNVVLSGPDAVLGTGTVVRTPGPTNGTFTITLNPRPALFHTIQASDVTRTLIGKIVPILNLSTDHSSLLSSCGVIDHGTSGGFRKTTYTCGLSRPRGIALDAGGNPLIIAGTAPRDPGYALLPAGVFRLSLSNRALSLFAPVNGVALKPGPGGAFGTDLFVARPRLFNVRGKALVQPGDGEIFRVAPSSSQIQVFTRLLDFTPTGMAFAPPASSFAGGLVVSNLFADPNPNLRQAGLQRITPTGSITSLFTSPRGLLGLAFGPGGAFGSELYAAQPGSGRIWRLSATGSPVSFASGMISPVNVAFGPGGRFGNDLYVADAGSDASGSGGKIWRINSAGGRTMFASGLGAPFDLVFRPTSPPTLFVTDYLSGNVVQFTAIP